MKMILILLAMLLQTRPATLPADPVEAAESSLAKAKTDAVAARDSVIAEIRATPEYEKARAEADRLKGILDAKREGAPMDERMKASSDYGTALAVVQKMEKSADLDTRVIDARAVVRDAEAKLFAAKEKAEIAAAEKEVAERRAKEASDPSNVTQDKVRVGMTLAQVRKAIGDETEVLSETESSISYRWGKLILMPERKRVGRETLVIVTFSKETGQATHVAW